MMHFCGLDFGTSNTICTVSDKEKSTNVLLDQNKDFISSCVFYSFKNLEHPIYGEIATQEHTNVGYGRYMKSFKRLLGTDFFDKNTLLKPDYYISHRKVIVDFLKHVKTKTENFIDAEIDYAVVGKPIRLSENHDSSKKGIDDLNEVLKEAGFKNYSFLDEPVAAAFYYRDKLKKDSKVFVADLGGGTCDFSIVNYTSNNEIETLSTSGISLGGTDIDSKFALDVFFPELGYKTVDKYKGIMIPDKPYVLASDWNKITTSLYTPKIEILINKMLKNALEHNKILQLKKLVLNKKAHVLLGQIEQAKIDLSNSSHIDFKSSFLDPNKTYFLRLKQLDDSATEMVNRILLTVDDCLNSSGVDKKNIEYLILTGGTSKLSLLKNLLAQKFHNSIIINSNPMDAVAQGLYEKAKIDIKC